MASTPPSPSQGSARAHPQAPPQAPSLAPERMLTPRTSPLDRVLESMRVGVHVMVAFLLLFATIRALLRADPTAVAALGAGGYRCATIVGATLFAAWYLGGTTWENRIVTGRARWNPGRRMPLLAAAWLAVVLAVWLALMAVAFDFVWLLFPLVFVIVHVLPTVLGLVITGAAWAGAVGASAWHSGWDVGGVVGPAIGVVFALAAYYVYRALHRQARYHWRVAEELRAAQQELLAAQEELLAAENRAGRLVERERFAREVHDTLAQGFSSIVLLARTAGNALGDGGADTSLSPSTSPGPRGVDSHATDTTSAAREQLRTIEEVAGENLNQARTLVRELSLPPDDPAAAAPAELPGRLPEELAGLAASVARRSGLDVHAHCEGPTDTVPPAGARALLRVAQEALTNTVRHAHARQAHLTLTVWDGQATLDIFDDGIGFPPDAPPPPGATSGYGIPGMRARLAEVGGDLTIDSTPGSTVLTACIPLKEGTPQ